MAGRFPAAASTTELWRFLRESREATRWFTDDELLAAGVSTAALSDPNYVRAGLVLPDMEMFDAEFFGFSQREAAILDPQHRHFLECAFEALEDAGHMPENFPGAVGVFAGCGMQAYLAYNLLSNPELVDSVGLFLLRHTGNDKDFLSTRASYLLNLQGPSVSVQTACSTSLVAVHMAAQSLLAGECDMALAGGVSIDLPHGRGYRYAEGEILSPDGHCRAFDDGANGTIFGSGVGIVVLRRLEDALADGDNIHAVIRGSAVNNDGSRKVGYLAPSVEGQARAAAEALSIADVEPGSVAYLEAHGTGTSVGDPIELAALAEAYGAASSKQFCGIGSLKTNIGHLDTAAGVAALIKVALAFRHELIPASLNFSRPNSRFELERSPFYVVDRPKIWPRNGVPRIAAVNSLGVGGTNAHVIVEEPPPKKSKSRSRQDWKVFTLSARTPAALEQLRDKWLDFLEEPQPGFALGDAAYTTQVGRRAFVNRTAVVARDVEGLRLALSTHNHPHAPTGKSVETPQVVFMFPGGGAQYPGVGRELLKQAPAFREAVESCFRLMPADVPADLHTLMFERDVGDEAATRTLERPSYAIPALFVLEYALARLCKSWGVEPDLVIGHSAGEYAAACLAGVMSLSDALSVVTLRGQIFEALPPGAMLAIELPEQDLRRAIGKDLDIAAINGSHLCVATGRLAAIEQLEQRLTEGEVECRRLRIDVAAHSRMLDPFLDRFRERLQTIRLSDPLIPFISNVTGALADPGLLSDPEYWVRHLRQPVRFADGLDAALRGPDRVLFELGPGQSLCALARQKRDGVAPLAVIPSTPKAQESQSELALMLAAAGRLWTLGKSIDWAALRDGDESRTSIPTYAFEHRRHWIEPGRGTAKTADEPASRDTDPTTIARIASVDDWFSRPTWIQAPLVPVRSDRKARWLVFADASPFSNAVLERLAKREAVVIVARPAAAFGKDRNGYFGIDPADAGHYRDLLNAMEQGGGLPDRILHLWSLQSPRPDVKRHDGAQTLGFESLLLLAQALQHADPNREIRLGVATAGSLAVAGEAVPFPERAALVGPCRVVPREVPAVKAQLIDLSPNDLGDPMLAERLLAECEAPPSDSLVALRGDVRWVQVLSSVQAQRPDNLPQLLRPNGVYLITGGLGDIALTLADYLTRQVKAKLALVGRGDLPPREVWSQLVASTETSRTADCVRRLLALETHGAEVLVMRADVGDLAAMQDIVDTVEMRFGPINGVFHAAGVIADAPLAVKSLEDARRVLAPKLMGGLVLDTLFRPGTLDFLAMFSSTSVFLGPPGQIDYVAANAVLDGLAASRPDGLSIHWGMWADRGMAARAYGAPVESAVPGVADRMEGVHPLLGTCREHTDAGAVFETTYDPRALWILKEHAVGECPVFPGTGYIELARAGWAFLRPSVAVEIRSLSIVAPMAFPAQRARRVRIEFTPDGANYRLAVRSAGNEGTWIEHAQAVVAALDPAEDESKWAQPPTLAHRFTPAESPSGPQSEAVSFGPRWRNIESLCLGEHDAEAEIELPALYAGDLSVFQAHPALMDMATTFGLYLVGKAAERDTVYVPISAERVRLYQPLPPRFRSHVQLVSHQPGSVVAFDVIITDEGGGLIASCKNFSMRAVTQLGTPEKLGRQSLPEILLSKGIRTAEAPELFARVLGGAQREIVVSSLPLADLRRMMATTKVKEPATPRDGGSDKPTYDNAVESDLAGIWSDLLGVDPVQPDDDFFALGGHSLAAVRLFAKVRKQFNVDLPLATLFQAPTLKELALTVAEKGGIRLEPFSANAAPLVPATPLDSSDNAAAAVAAPARAEWSPLVPICRGQPGRLRLYCVHGGGGNVLNLKALSDKLGRDQPFYGLQAQGVDGRLPPLGSIEAMAASYIAAIRAVDPDGPLCLAGYSGGGVVAFEMAQQLASQGRTVPFLLLFDTLAPHAAVRPMPLVEKIWSARRWSMRFALDWPRRLRQRRVTEDRRRQVRAWIQRNERVPHEFLDVYLMDAYLEAQSRYQTRAYAGSMTILRAREASTDYVRAGPKLGWESFVQGGIEVYEVNSDHLTMMEKPAIDEVAAIVKARMEALHASFSASPDENASLCLPG